MRRFRRLLACLFCVAFLSARVSGEEAPRARLPLDRAVRTVTAAELRAHLAYIASDELQGRDAGSEGCRKAAEYIRKEFRFCGLAPLGDPAAGQAARSYFQALQVIRGAELATDGNFLSVTSGGRETQFASGKDYLPLSLSANAAIRDKPLVFVGYGITSKRAGYDDYAGVDVKGKVVVMLRYEHKESVTEVYQPSRHAWFSTKVQNAIRHGAAGILIVNGPRNKHAGDGDPFVGLGNVGRVKNKTVPVIQAKQAAVAKLFSESLETLPGLQEELDKKKKPRSFLIPRKTITLGVRLVKRKAPTANVLGLLEGSDPDLKDQYVVVGAHYDHVGLGHYGSRWRSRGRGKVHNGADDNGSGTVAVLEVAEAIAWLTPRPKRSLLFVLFTGEERGLIGSRYFVEHPTVPRSKIVAMINADMIGRAGKGGRLSIAGAGTSSAFKKIIARENAGLGLKIRTIDSGRTPSDNAAFVAKKIPVLFYFTGLHKDYHTPNDDVDRINFPDHARITRHMARVAVALANREGAIDYVDVGQRRGVRLGIQPDTDRLPAIVVAAVLRGSPAQKAGVIAGDEILEIGGHKIGGIQDVHEALGKQKRGGKATIKVKRKGSGRQEKTLELPVAF